MRNLRGSSRRRCSGVAVRSCLTLIISGRTLVIVNRRAENDRPRIEQTPVQMPGMRTHRRSPIPHSGLLFSEVHAEGQLLQESRFGPALGSRHRACTYPHLFSNENNVLQWSKTGSSLSRNGPLNLLGGGSWCWPCALPLDRKTLEKIRHSEVGGELMVPPEEDAR